MLLFPRPSLTVLNRAAAGNTQFAVPCRWDGFRSKFVFNWVYAMQLLYNRIQLLSFVCIIASKVMHIHRSPNDDVKNCLECASHQNENDIHSVSEAYGPRT